MSVFRSLFSLMGYLGLTQRSPVLGGAVAGNVHRGLLRRQMLVVGSGGCQVIDWLSGWVVGWLDWLVDWLDDWMVDDWSLC